MYTTNNFHYGIIPAKEYDLPATRQKSFYGKASIIEDVNGEIFLRSYDTLVAYINKAGEFIRLWDGYSVTTMNHINDFLRFFNIPGGGKKWWEALEVEKH